MRIIAGKYRGKKIFQPIDNHTRPLKDLVKESIFNLIVHSNKINFKIENTVILDLFAGSGSFGLECASRNSKEIIFFENNPNAIKILKKNLNIFKEFNKYKIYERNCFEYFNSKNNLDNKFDIIFLDPPYKEKRTNEILNNILKVDIIKPEGIIILHRHKKDDIGITDKLKIFEERKYGLSKIFFCKKN
tara:strand:- start:113 stop:679 length:567 start_codon:yes stop_codon:yes gene_type:complete